MTSLEKQIDQLMACVSSIEKINPQVSAASVGWHLDHSLLVIQTFVKFLAASDPAQYQPKFSLAKFIILGLGRIPRGKAKAPDRVIPREATTATLLEQSAQKAKAALLTIDSIPAGAFMPHPLFGHLRKKTALRFAQVHTQHHLNIVRDIIASA